MTDHITEASRVGRIPVVFVELDMDYCTRTYGTSPCTASVGVTGAAKCYNTYATCQDTANYNKGMKTYRFSDPSARLPVGLQTIPLLKSVSFAPQQITPGKGLGVRGSVSIKLADAPWTDVDIDPYVADRATQAAGTFWGRFRARNPYYEGRMLRILAGYITSPFTWDAFQVRAYIIDSLSAVLKGDEAQIVGKDILKLADDKKALFPRPSTGTLSAGISDSATTLTAAPTGVGAAEYPASGKIAISGEIMSFTRSGDVFTVTRAQDNTDAAAHDADDTIQLVGEFTSAEIQDVIYTLLTDYAGIDTAYIDKTAWDTERDTYLTGVWNLTQPEPVGVNTLLAELTEQGNCRIWWDEIEQQIRFRAIRPLDAALPVYSDDDHFIQNTVDLRDDPKQRISSVLIYFGRRSPAEKLDELKNYAVRYLQADPDASGANQYGSAVIKRINSRWFLSTSLGRVQDLADALLMTFRDPPRILSFGMDPRHDLRVGDIFRAQTRYLQAADGSKNELAFEVIEAQEERAGHLIRYRAQSMPADIPLVGEYSIVFSADEFDVVLYDVFMLEYGVPTSAVTLAVEIQSGVLISATSTSIPAFRVGTGWPDGTVITLVNAGTIAGRGGDGGHGGSASLTLISAPTAGGDGGPGLDATDWPMEIDNTSGIISGGSGAGGGGGAGRYLVTSSNFAWKNGGSGGGGWPFGAAGTAYYGGNSGSAASPTDGGTGGEGETMSSITDPGVTATSGDGAPGGGQYAAAGSAGSNASTTGTGGSSIAQSGAPGGVAGPCVVGNSNITWTATGTRYGAIT
ncbi:MAG TPA: hypothetical protein VFW42_07805 [Fluviicoccus sp.]|nr:hypothetical protein [Fluviicoccus sp.]